MSDPLALLASYFHQDADLDGDTTEAIASVMVAPLTREARVALVAALDALLVAHAETPDDELRALLYRVHHVEWQERPAHRFLERIRAVARPSDG